MKISTHKAGKKHIRPKSHDAFVAFLKERGKNKTIILIHLMRNLKAMRNPTTAKIQRDATILHWAHVAFLANGEAGKHGGAEEIGMAHKTEGSVRDFRNEAKIDKCKKTIFLTKTEIPLISFSADYLLSFTSCCHRYWWCFGDYVRNSIVLYRKKWTRTITHCRETPCTFFFSAHSSQW